MAKVAFLTNYALVLIHVYEHPRSTLREISGVVGITERASLSNLRQLEEEGLVSRTKQGRQNSYTVNVPAILEWQALGPYTVEQIVRFLKNLADQHRDQEQRGSEEQDDGEEDCPGAAC